jgi:aquaporin Z
VNRVARHWREYAMEGGLLGAFMVVACLFGTLLEHPESPLHQVIPAPWCRRVLMGITMGATSIALVRSRWGRITGAHMNPALTLTYLRLGKVMRADALGYVLAHFVGGALGVAAMRALLGGWLADPHVHYVATLPGAAGEVGAFLAEVGISFVLVTVILVVSNHPRWTATTPWCCGALVATFIAVEAPLSGMSMNPARSFASALVAVDPRALWIYFTAPPLGMLLAAEMVVRGRGVQRVVCAKLDHSGTARCIFRCNWPHAGQ